MGAHVSSVARPDVHGINRGLMAARDEQIGRVVAMVDKLPDRGEADALIAPLRARLAQLRPNRPLNFARLLFRPLDPLILSAASWRRGRIGLPRSALAPLAAQCRALLGAAAESVEDLIEGHQANDSAAVREAGARLWPLAASALADAAPTATWPGATGLAAGDHADAVRLIVAVLGEANEIERLVAGALESRPPGVAELRPLVTRAASAGDARVLGGLLAVLLARLPGSDRLFATIGAIASDTANPAAGRAAGAAVDQALNFMLDNVDAAMITELPLGPAAEELCRVAALLDGMERLGFGNRATRRVRGAAIRQSLADACQSRFAAELREAVLLPLAAGEAVLDDAAQTAIEAAARGLRQFQETSRALAGEAIETTLRDAAGALRAGPGPLVDRMRIVEILFGPDRAAAILAELS